MKKRLAILLLSVMVLTCALTALSAAAASYTDALDLLPASEEIIKVNGGVPVYELKDGKLSLTRDGADNIAWPSIVYEVNQEADLSKTPYLHMNFETSGEGDRGVNGFLYYSVDNGEEQSAQLSDAGGNGIDDFRDSADMMVNLANYLGINGTIYIHRIALSVYGGMGETIVWNTLALASSGEGGDEPAPEESSEEPEESSEDPAVEESSEDDTSSAEPAESTPAESSTAPETTSEAASETSSDASSEETSDSSGTLAIILVVIAVVAVVAVVVIVIVKKKK